MNQIENLQEQLRDKDKQLGNLKDRIKSLQTDSSNTDTALATLEEALSEKVEHITGVKLDICDKKGLQGICRAEN